MKCARWLLLMSLCCSAALSQQSYSPALNRPAPTRVLWGDLHLHTSLSFDSFGYGNKSIGPQEAYRFARGEAVAAHNGMQVQLTRPLDFLVVADHSEFLGVLTSIETGEADDLDPSGDSAWKRLIAEARNRGKDDPAASEQLISKASKDPFFDSPHFKQTIWSGVVAAADRFNDPGKFTALIGYEWTAPISLHRVVIFRDGADKAGRIIPLSAYNSPRPDPELLWEHMREYVNATGGDVLAIPHNPNLSNGLAFALEDIRSNPISRDHARRRNKWEPLLEVTQIKGDSETHPLLSPTDEFADYERMDIRSSYGPRGLSDEQKLLAENGVTEYYDSWLARASSADDAWLRKYEYARSGLKLGLAQHAALGVNPFKFGFVGGTDSHTGLSTADEDNFWGKMPTAEPHARRITAPWYPGQVTRIGWMMNAAGHAAVWAAENTRESIFDALKRREVYATTGPRITVRFFGGWDFVARDATVSEVAAVGYAKGVPMGGDLSSGPNGRSPRFLVRALKDPEGGNLDRVQIIKGWRDAKGETHERVYEVALSDGRVQDSRGQVPPVGSTVDVADASYTNTIGDPELAAVWTDPDFRPDDLAFYYARVIEIPTPRWTAFDARFFGVDALPGQVPMITQERAYTSPIWYTPAEFK